MKIVTVIQARRGSTRLPDKILLPLAGRELLVRMVERVLAAKLSGTVVVATTTNKEDDVIQEICQREGYNYYRGHETDLLDRHYRCALEFDAEAVVKIPSDCPLIDPKVIDKVLSFFIENADKYDFVSNLHPATYPDGNDVEITHMHILKQAWENAERQLEREHTTPYIWENEDKYRCENISWETGLDYSMSHRFTIDYQEDYDFIKTVYDKLYDINPVFRLEDIIALIEKEPEIYEINSKYLGVNWYRNHINELKTIDKSQTRQI